MNAWRPEGSPSAIPYLVVQGAEQVADFLRAAFGAVEFNTQLRSDGRIKHARFRIRDSVIMLAEATDDWRPTRSCTYLYVPDVDATYSVALAAGGRPLLAPGDRPFGERNAGVADPAGNEWWMATCLG